jgi:hypothetical protein
MAAFRGVSCEEMAIANALLAGGYGSKESLVKSTAENVKVALGRAISEKVNGMLRSLNADKDSEITEGYFEQFLNKAHTIRTNTYVKPDDTCHVYVCVEIGEDTLAAMHKKLSEDKKIPTDFSAQQFIQEMKKVRLECSVRI